MTDAEATQLAADIAQGKTDLREGVERLYRAYSKLLLGFLKNGRGNLNLEDLEEAFAETWLEVCKRLKQGQFKATGSRPSFRGWLCTIAVHKREDLRRKGQRLQPFKGEPELVGSSDGESALPLQFWAGLEKIEEFLRKFFPLSEGHSNGRGRPCREQEWPVALEHLKRACQGCRKAEHQPGLDDHPETARGQGNEDFPAQEFLEVLEVTRTKINGILAEIAPERLVKEGRGRSRVSQQGSLALQNLREAIEGIRGLNKRKPLAGCLGLTPTSR